MVIRYRLKMTGESPFSFYFLYRANAVSGEQILRTAAGVYREEVRAANIGGYMHTVQYRSTAERGGSYRCKNKLKIFQLLCKIS